MPPIDVNTGDCVEAFLAWGIIPDRCTCRCGRQMRAVRRKSQLGFRWICGDGCGVKSALEGTFFERSHLCPLSVARLLYHFLVKDKLVYAATSTGLPKKTVVDCSTSFAKSLTTHKITTTVLLAVVLTSWRWTKAGYSPESTIGGGSYVLENVRCGYLGQSAGLVGISSGIYQQLASNVVVCWMISGEFTLARPDTLSGYSGRAFAYA
ncbi:unnamed protein product [Orchesella dallaii]|uniref:Uncharacterized protein n=1 Tax=Orchesella dallaii TaxID=48710 RepID=A0ABP1QXM6_9HEXA